MAERSGFYNANKLSGGSYDRTYDASDFAKYFANFIGNGVYGSPADQLKVVPNTGLSVKVKAGKAFIDGYWYELDEDKTIQLSVNTGTGSSSSVIVAELNKTNRAIVVKAREFVSSVYPINSSNIHELVLAVITNNVGATEITSGYISDTRFKSDYCGLVTGLIKQLDIGTAYSQLEAQFNTWFDSVKGTLSGDVAANLQKQINDLPTIRSGTTDPDNSVGKDGDIYIKFSEE